MEYTELTINIVPKSVQSFRIGRYGGYQDKKVVAYKKEIRRQAEEALGENWEPFSCMVVMDELIFMFPLPKNTPKYVIQSVESGFIYYRESTPDLEDNMAKGLFDALNGLLMEDDKQIVESRLRRKIFTAGEPGIYLKCHPMNYDQKEQMKELQRCLH